MQRGGWCLCFVPAGFGQDRPLRHHAPSHEPVNNNMASAHQRKGMRAIASLHCRSVRHRLVGIHALPGMHSNHVNTTESVTLGTGFRCYPANLCRPYDQSIPNPDLAPRGLALGTLHSSLPPKNSRTIS